MFIINMRGISGNISCQCPWNTYFSHILDIFSFSVSKSCYVPNCDFCRDCGICHESFVSPIIIIREIDVDMGWYKDLGIMIINRTLLHARWDSPLCSSDSSRTSFKSQQSERGECLVRHVRVSRNSFGELIRQLAGRFLPTYICNFDSSAIMPGYQNYRTVQSLIRIPVLRVPTETHN